MCTKSFGTFEKWDLVPFMAWDRNIYYSAECSRNCMEWLYFLSTNEVLDKNKIFPSHAKT